MGSVESSLKKRIYSIDRLEDAIRAANRAADLTRRLLAFSRKQSLHPELVDLSAIVNGMDQMLRRTFPADIDIELNREACPWSCEADPAQLENMLLNLAINARDAMPEGGKLTIETSNIIVDCEFQQRHPDVIPGQYVMLTVSDTGYGMSPDIKARAFTPFFTTKDRGQGSGLGLSMVYGFVKQTGGYLNLHSEDGAGTTIKVYLPRSTEETEEAVQPSATIDEPQGDGENILVVEDDASVRELTVNLLGGLGYKTLEAGDAQSALDVLKKTDQIDLLLSDVVLPGSMNGVQLSCEAKNIHANLNVLFMSGYTENALINNNKQDSGVELLEKPFTRLQLAQKVSQMLQIGD